MKCICGYAHEDGIDDNGDWQKNLIGDKKFIQIRGNFFIEDDYSYHRDEERISLYACPKCGTVRMDE